MRACDLFISSRDIKNYYMFSECSSLILASMKEKNGPFNSAYPHYVPELYFRSSVIFFKFVQHFICTFENTCPFQCCPIVSLSLLECRDGYELRVLHGECIVNVPWMVEWMDSRVERAIYTSCLSSGAPSVYLLLKLTSLKHGLCCGHFCFQQCSWGFFPHSKDLINI